MLGLFLDTETNGLSSQIHSLLEISLWIVDLKTGEVKEKFHSLVTCSQEEWAKSDPESLKINGFSFEELALAPSKETIQQKILSLFDRFQIVRKKAFFICQNPSFDRAFFSQIVDPMTQEKLRWPYHWLDLASMHWALLLEKRKTGKGLFPWETGVSKDSIAAFYNLPPEEKPHRAENGVAHLFLCYQAAVGWANQ